MIKELTGDLFEIILSNNFDITIQGCNCVCKQKSGIAKQFVKHFETHEFPMESKHGINKLGAIDGRDFMRSNGVWLQTLTNLSNSVDNATIRVYNCYTQVFPANMLQPKYTNDIPVDYEAIRLCFRKINILESGKKLIMPWIGCGLAKGNRGVLRKIILEELTDIDVAIVNYNK